MKTRTGDFIETSTGRNFFPLDPRPENVEIEDIAHSLSHICRFNGHCRYFFSVAQHSVFVSRMVPKKHALWGLLHDGAEAYLADLAAPVKPFIHGWKNIEEQIQRAVCQRFGLKWPQPPEIKVADLAMVVTEGKLLMPSGTRHWALAKEIKPLEIKIHPAIPEEAKAMFLRRFSELTE